MWPLLLLFLLWPSLGWSAPNLSESDWIALKALARGGGGAGGSVSSGSGLPATCTPGTGPNALFLDTDTELLYYCSASNIFTLLLISVAEEDTLDSAFDRGKVIDGANSLANALRIGDGTTPICLYTDATLGPVIKPCTDANTRTHIWTNFTWGLRDHEGDADMLIVDPDAATKKAMWAFQSGYYPLKSVWIPAGNLDGDGTNCPASPTAVTINSGPKRKTFICADNNGSRLNIGLKAPNDWDGGTFTLTAVVIQTAADTAALHSDTAWQCRGNGEPVSNSWGTEVAMDLANLTGSNANDFIPSGNITATGTCASADMLYGYWDVDATGTTTGMTTLHILGFLLTYSSTSLSH